jgi:hypothetical protein
MRRSPLGLLVKIEIEQTDKVLKNLPPTNFASRRPLPKFGGKTFEARNAPSAHMRRWGVKSDKPSIASATQCPKSSLLSRRFVKLRNG